MTRSQRIKNLLRVIRKASASEHGDDLIGWRFPSLEEWARIKKLAAALESPTPKRKAKPKDDWRGPKKWSDAWWKAHDAEMKATPKRKAGR